MTAQHCLIAPPPFITHILLVTLQNCTHIRYLHCSEHILKAIRQVVIYVPNNSIDRIAYSKTGGGRLSDLEAFLLISRHLLLLD